MWLLAACIGLDALPEKGGKDGDDLDSVPLETGYPLDDSGTTGAGDNHAPVADAGDDREVTVGLVVDLDGTASTDPDGDAIAYSWALAAKPNGSSAEIANDTRPEASFVPDLEGRYEVELVVDDGQAESRPDSIEITATEENGAPVANAGRDQTVAVGASVSLDGSVSSDPDGDPLQYAWTLASRPSGSAAALSSSSSVTPRFTADVAGAYEITLTVTDGVETSAPDEVRVIAETGGGDTTGGDDCGCRGPGAETGIGVLLAMLGLRRRRL